MDLNLKDFAESDNELLICELKEQRPTAKWADIAQIANFHVDSCRKIYRRVKDRANKRGFVPELGYTNAAPPNFFASKISTYYKFGEDDPEGRVGQWVQTKPEIQETWHVLSEYIKDLSEGIQNKSPSIDLQNTSCLTNPDAKDYLKVYAIGDPHIGMHAWGEETLENYDVDIAEKFNNSAIDYLVRQGDPIEKCLILCVGDLFHADDSTNMTPASKNILDVDTRFQRWFEIGMNTIHYAIQKALEYHQFVDVIIVPGNHDPHVTRALNVSMKMYYKNNDRVNFDDSPREYRYYHFGNVIIGSAHGHNTRKLSDLVGLMANDCRETWSNSNKNYWYLGHYHHKNIQTDEISGVEIEILRTLAPPDAWHYGKGYRSGRAMTAIVHHKQFGEIQRYNCPVELLKTLCGVET